MTRETRIALLVGLAFIVLFGLVLGQRSLNNTSAATSGTSTTAASRTGAPDVVVAAMAENPEDRPALAPGTNSHPPTDVAAAPPAPTTAPIAGAWTEPPLPEVARAGSPPGTDGPAPPVSPPVPPAGPTVVPPPSTPAGSSYTVQPGDTLIRIARKVYGRGHENEYQRILQANRVMIPSPTSLLAGKVLAIPALETAAAEAGASGRTATTRPTAERGVDPFSNKTYVVQKGDILGDIAKKTLGSSSPAAVKKLVEANKDRINNPDRLRVGTTLKIPTEG